MWPGPQVLKGPAKTRQMSAGDLECYGMTRFLLRLLFRCFAPFVVCCRRRMSGLLVGYSMLLRISSRAELPTRKAGEQSTAAVALGFGSHKRTSRLAAANVASLCCRPIFLHSCATSALSRKPRRMRNLRQS